MSIDVDSVNQQFTSSSTCNSIVGGDKTDESPAPTPTLTVTTPTPPPPGPSCYENDPSYPDDFYNCMSLGGASWDGYPNCRCSDPSPVLLDVSGDGFALTDAAGGVNFDLNADGQSERLSWTAAGSDDAWLVLDRNGDGIVDDGGELFGNYTPQPAPPAGLVKNGFNALAEYDQPQRGGNGDGVIDGNDAVFYSLRLWQDVNHDGVSQPGELHALPELGLQSIDLKYGESKRTDEYGNHFRYRAKVSDAHGAKIARWAWDVFLLRGR